MVRTICLLPLLAGTLVQASADEVLLFSYFKGYLPVMEHEPHARNCWAPEITYDPGENYWATTIPGRFPETDAAGDNGYNHRLYYVTTRDFQKFSPTALLYEPGFNVIDASIVNDGPRWVMFLKDETRYPPAKNIRVAFSDALRGPWGPPSDPITRDYWAEGPSALKLGDKWIVYFDKCTRGTYGAVVSEDLETWTDVSDRVSFPPGARHGTAFRVTRAEFERIGLR